MILWLDEKVPCRFPHYAHHYVGVGGAMVNEKYQIMLIKENRSLDARKWKLPGGFMDPKESLREAVEREVREETGVVAKFEAVCAMREQSDYKYD
jgi:ADP-ribose pyrophosphatase YjhB (NUDIX family)